jgi:response regulator RpfG family c-di-GMP phosphodiesterase
MARIYIQQEMSVQHRLGFLVVETEPPQGLSTRKLLLETAQHNVISAHSPEEGVEMFHRFPNVDVVAVDGSFSEANCASLVRAIKQESPNIRVVAFLPNVAGHCHWADETISSHDPAGLLKLLQEMGGRTDVS